MTVPTVPTRESAGDTTRLDNAVRSAASREVAPRTAREPHAEG